MNVAGKWFRLLAFGLSFFALAVSPCFADLHTAVASGNFSTSATWNQNATPVDGDTFAITGYAVTFDMDQSAWTGMGASSIGAGGSLTWSTTAGTYVLKMVGSLSGAGTLTIGTSVAVPYPAACLAKIIMVGAYSINLATSGAVNIYCRQPTIEYVKLTANAAINATTLNIDTNVTGDIWAATDQVRICTRGGRETTTELRTISSITASTIVITAGLTAAKTTGDYVALITRNVQLIGNDNSSGYALNGLANGNVTALISDWGRGVQSCSGTVVDGVIDSCGTALGTQSGIITYSGVISGCTYWAYNSFGIFVNGTVLGCAWAQYCQEIVFSGHFACSNYFASQCSDIIIYDATIRANITPFASVSNILCVDSTITTNTTSGFNLITGKGNKLFNTLLGDSSEVTNYNSALVFSSTYLESYDHDQVADAYRAWTKGGIVDKVSGVYPTGKTFSYQHACASATYPCFRQIQLSIDPNQWVRVNCWLRQSVDMAINPKVELIAVSADPLMDSTQTALATFTMGDSVNTFEQGTLNYHNTGTRRIDVLVRATGQNANGTSHDYIEVKTNQGILVF